MAIFSAGVANGREAHRGSAFSPPFGPRQGSGHQRRPNGVESGSGHPPSRPISVTHHHLYPSTTMFGQPVSSSLHWANSRRRHAARIDARCQVGEAHRSLEFLKDFRAAEPREKSLIPRPIVFCLRLPVRLIHLDRPGAPSRTRSATGQPICSGTTFPASMVTARSMRAASS